MTEDAVTGDVQRIRAAHVVTRDGIRADAVVEVSGARVTEVRSADDNDGPAVDGWLVPGFVDVHVHGGGGHDYATTDADEARAAQSFHAHHGTTTSFASLVTAPLDVLCRQLTVLARLVADGLLAGVHLEGPFLAPEQRGAHDPSLLRAPDPDSVGRLMEAGQGALAMVTLAPELPGALDAIRQLAASGVRVAVGHTNADDETVARAIDAGASVGTHVFNAMRGLHHRVPGPVPRLLTDPRVAAEVIADGFHVHPEILRLAYSAAGPDQLMLVTDAMAAAGHTDGAYRLGSLDVLVVDGEARLVDADGSAGSIAGSTLTMAGAFAQMTEIIGEVAPVAALASTNAARHFSLDAGYVGVGGPADLCVVDDTGALVRVMYRGRWLESV